MKYQIQIYNINIVFGRILLHVSTINHYINIDIMYILLYFILLFYINYNL